MVLERKFPVRLLDVVRFRVLLEVKDIVEINVLLVRKELRNGVVVVHVERMSVAGEESEETRLSRILVTRSDTLPAWLFPTARNTAEDGPPINVAGASGLLLAGPGKFPLTAVAIACSQRRTPRPSTAAATCTQKM